jgi:hypothetical protein
MFTTGQNNRLGLTAMIKTPNRPFSKKFFGFFTRRGLPSGAERKNKRKKEKG